MENPFAVYGAAKQKPHPFSLFWSGSTSGGPSKYSEKETVHWGRLRRVRTSKAHLFPDSRRSSVSLGAIDSAIKTPKRKLSVSTDTSSLEKRHRGGGGCSNHFAVGSTSESSHPPHRDAAEHLAAKNSLQVGPSELYPNSPDVLAGHSDLAQQDTSSCEQAENQASSKQAEGTPGNLAEEDGRQAGEEVKEAKAGETSEHDLEFSGKDIEISGNGRGQQHSRSESSEDESMTEVEEGAESDTNSVNRDEDESETETIETELDTEPENESEINNGVQFDDENPNEDSCSDLDFEATLPDAASKKQRARAQQSVGKVEALDSSVKRVHGLMPWRGGMLAMVEYKGQPESRGFIDAVTVRKHWPDEYIDFLEKKLVFESRIRT
mmetsp:Transcript_21824/g.49357  ORF Transcript_21824/g.49357 Transcript_21824/m.49357 type:complete len:380 (-) Transcript_21824:124-1263(-)